MYSRTSFIYKYKRSTLTPFVKPHNVLNLAVQNIFYVQSFVESAFMYNPGSTVLQDWSRGEGAGRVQSEVGRGSDEVVKIREVRVGRV